MGRWSLLRAGLSCRRPSWAGSRGWQLLELLLMVQALAAGWSGSVGPIRATRAATTCSPRRHIPMARLGRCLGTGRPRAHLTSSSCRRPICFEPPLGPPQRFKNTILPLLKIPLRLWRRQRASGGCCERSRCQSGGCWCTYRCWWCRRRNVRRRCCLRSGWRSGWRCRRRILVRRCREKEC